MAALSLDASVLIALLDRADGHHLRAVDEVESADADGRALFVPVTAYSEALVAFARADRLRDARAATVAMGIAVTPMTAAIGERAAELRARHRSLRLPDAIVLASAIDVGGELLTYDQALARIARRNGV